MNEREIQQNEEVEIDLRRIFEAVWNRIWLVAMVSVLGAVVAFLVTLFVITPKYESSAMFYVNNNSLSVGDASFSISSGDLSTSRNLVESYIVILNTRESLNDVIDYADVNRTYAELKEMITAASVNETEIFEVIVTSTNPKEAEKIANAIAYILPKRISSIIEGTSAKVVDAAVIPSKPSSPSYTNNTVIGFLLGLVLTVGIIALREIFDITIRSEEDIAQVCKHPVLAAVPDMQAPSKGGYYTYDTGNKGSHKADTFKRSKQAVLVGADINFAASEAYKLLRTKLQFSFADEKNSRVIGVSSALSGEGKSLTSVNLAYSLSELNKRVLLIDCDMRRPSLAAKLPIVKAPGLSDYLSGQCDPKTMLQFCQIKGNEDAFVVIAAGRNPPNPIELLSSNKMSRMIEQLRKAYDYIILDLPPVGEVSDALAVAKLTDGMLLVSRQNYGNRVAFGAAVRQFEFVESKILGIIYNCTTESSGAYGKKYYKKYYNSANNAYQNAAEKKPRKTAVGKAGEPKDV